MRKLKTGGGWPAVMYSLKKGRAAGGLWKFFKALSSKNACKTCAVGMGGQRGGMRNELGHFPEVCKKAMQAMAADMQGAIKPDYFATYSIPQMQRFSPRELETAGRLTQPVILRRAPSEERPGTSACPLTETQYYQPIAWDDALRRITDLLKATPADETFWYFSGRSSNEAGFLLQLFARLYGTNNVNNCSYYCHQASGVGLTSVTGSGTATLTLEDVEKTDLVFIIGGNPASNHPRLMTVLKNIRRRGGQVIVINPVIETGLVNFSVPSDPVSLVFGTKIATQYIQPHIGGDMALLTGIAKRIDEMGAIDERMLQEHCEGWPELAAHLRATTWEEICRKSGVAKQDIDRAAETYAAAKSAVFAWTMGITHHANGVENVQMISALALMRGMVGRPDAGLLPIRGHSNVQGIGSMGVTPKLKDAIFDRLQTHYGVRLPTTAGLDTLACMEGADAGRLKFGFCLGGNLYGSNPDATYAAQSLSRLKMLVYLNTTLNTGHAHGLAEETIILPVLARDEEPQATTQESMFNYVRLSDGGPPRHPGPKSEVEVIATIAAETLGTSGPIDWRGMQATGKIREMIATVVPGFEQLRDIDQTKQEFQIDGRTFHEPKFPTASGKARLHVCPIPELAGATFPPLPPGGWGEGESEAVPPFQGDSPIFAPQKLGQSPVLRLMTVRSEGQFNTVVYEDYDLYRGQDRRDVILLHPDDIARLGVKPEQRVTVRSETGAMPNILVRSYPEIRAGNALMYYPEANVLVPRSMDPRSKTPAFKNVLVTVEAKVAVTLA